jgi:SAM-dependent methyltransferase
MADHLFDCYNDSQFQAPKIFSEAKLRQSVEKYIGYEKILPRDRNAKILDIGCGAGYFLHFLREKGYQNIRGIDLSQQMVGICNANFLDIQAEVADGASYLKAHERSFDVIVANDVLEHVPKDRTVGFVKSAYRALMDNGKLLIKVPNLGNPFAVRLRYMDFTHEIGFTEQSLSQVLWLGGFRRINILPFPLNSPISLKLKIENFISKGIFFGITKIMQYQGFVAPGILTPSLFAEAIREHVPY